MQVAYIQVAESLRRSTNQKDLDEAANFIQYVNDIGQRDELSRIYKKKRDDFMEAKQ